MSGAIVNRRRSRLAHRRAAVGLSQERLAEVLGVDRSTVVRWERGDTQPQPWSRPRLARALQISIDELADLLAGAAAEGDRVVSDDGYSDAVELANRVAASDVSGETLRLLEEAADRYAIAYAITPPAELLPTVRQHLDHLTGLVPARKTLVQQRRLLVAGGWLSLLGATLHVDLGQDTAARTRLATAGQLAAHAGHAELRAWCLETWAWRVLTDGDFRQAAAVSRRAQELAPAGGSARIQATAQEGRALARMGDRPGTVAVLERLHRLVSGLERPARPEHHYRYDPAKAASYTATTLAWVGDPAAEGCARDVVRELESAADGVRRPRRVVAAKLDLGLALLSAGKPDESATVALEAIGSGRIVPSNHWRVAEIVRGVAAADAGQARPLTDAYRALVTGA